MKVDVRVVSATNKNLVQQVQAGHFREDLLYRLNVVSIKLPTLLERKEDIPLLIDYFLKHKSKANPKRVSAEAMAILMRYDWPGNVRELEHVIEGAAVLSQDDVIGANDLWINPSLAGHTAAIAQVNHTGTPDSHMSLDEIEKIHIEKVLKSNQWNRVRSAQVLGITPKTLYLKIKKYKIKVDDAPEH
jgi:DNA-binding NtrC family response regulator